MFDEALFERGYRLALVAVELRESVATLDLCDPFGDPVALHLDSPAVVAAAAALGIEIE